jgi:hypothetical protein
LPPAAAIHPFAKAKEKYKKTTGFNGGWSFSTID